MEIEKKVEDLVETIKETEKYQNYKEAKEAFENHPEAQDLLEEFQEAKSELAILKEGGFDGVEEQQKKVDELSEKVLDTKEIQDYKKAREEYKELVENLTVSISKQIDFPLQFPDKSCGC